MTFWAGQTISVFGSVVGIAAMGFTAIALHATAVQMSLLSAARLAAGFLVGLPAGAWIDRLRRRPILIGADIGRALLLATIPVAAIFGRLRMEQLYAVTFLVSILTVFFDIAYHSWLPSLTGRARLIEGNSKLAASASAAEVGGFAIAGWLVGHFTAPVALLTDAASFAVSAGSLALIGAPEPQPQPSPEPDMFSEINEGVRTILHHPLLRAMAACTLTKEFFGGMFGTLVLLYLARDLGFAPAILGSIFAVGGVSSLVGASSAASLTKRFGTGPAMIGGLATFGAALFLVPLAGDRTVFAAILLILQQLGGDCGATVYQITTTTVRQSVTPDRLLGRVNAGTQILTLGATLAGSLVGGFMGDSIGVRTTLLIGASGLILSTLWLIFSPVRRKRM